MTTPSEILNRAADLIRDTAALAVAPPWSQSLRSVMHGPDEEHEVALTPTTTTARWIALMSPAVAPSMEAMLRAAAHDVTVSGMVLNSVQFKAALADRFAAPLALAAAVLGHPEETT